MAAETSRHPRFARFFRWVAPAMDRGGLGEHRRPLLAGLTGDLIETGVGEGRNLPHYPPTVDRLVAVEPEPLLRQASRAAAEDAPFPVDVVDGCAERLDAADGSFDAAVATCVLCSVQDPTAALRELFRVLRPGGQLRFIGRPCRRSHRGGPAACTRRHGLAPSVRWLPHQPRRADHHDRRRVPSRARRTAALRRHVHPVPDPPPRSGGGGSTSHGTADMTLGSAVIDVEQLTKSFGPLRAVDGLTFRVDPGAVTGFLGPNGAGKTNTLRMLLGLTAPDAGTATIDGRPYRQLDQPARRVGAALDQSGFHPARNGQDHLRVLASQDCPASSSSKASVSCCDDVSGRDHFGTSVGGAVRDTPMVATVPTDR